jgi:flagellar biosynthesis protein FlhF
VIIKKFQAQTETEAIVLAKNELGKDAIVMNIKTISPKGIYRLFKKPLVEVTAAIDDTSATVSEKSDNNFNQERHFSTSGVVYDNILNNVLDKKKIVAETINKVKDDAKEETAIEKKLNALQALLEKQLEEKKSEDMATMEKDMKEEQNKPYLDLVYNQLLKNEVDKNYVSQIINELENKFNKDTPIDNVLSNVYQKIILKLGQPKAIELKADVTKFVFFIGPTGVGKTTTIAKIASDFKLNKKVKVAMLTSDTYRIAAVEQLRTYANILGIPMQVIYTEAEIEKAREDFSDYDLVLVDTAGRSHKNLEQRDDLDRLINTIPKEDREIYLVLSATTKYKDLIRITESYSDFTDYRLIFTKLDETISIGNIFNIKMHTNADLSYTTYGQNVPDDINKIDTQETAKKLLGGND